VSRRAFQKRQRQSLIWYLVGFFAVQLALGVGVERFWTAVRDPDYNEVEQIIRARQMEAPNRPLVLVLGSSRTQLGLEAGRLNESEETNAPLVINAGFGGGGPMLSQVVLRRLLQAHLRPRLVCLEIMPMALSAADGAPIEERRSSQCRYSVLEALRLRRYCVRQSWLWFNWVAGRVLPCARHAAELRDGLRIDLPVTGRPRESSRDRYGWISPPGPSQPKRDALTRAAFEEYRPALEQPKLARGPLQAFGDLLALCRREHLATVIFVPPESRLFRTCNPSAAATQMDVLRDLAQEWNVPLVDARAWIEDAGFFDGHHLHTQGALQFTERFGREVLSVARW
jgi:hypothetical protein